jgi:hypothetical protein
LKLFIHAEIGNWQNRGYDKGWLHFASSLSDDVLGTDLDNQSETMIADLVAKLIDQSEKVFLLVEIHEPGQSLGGIARLLDHLKGHPKAGVVVCGNPDEVQKIGFDGQIFEADPERIKEQIKKFAQ